MSSTFVLSHGSVLEWIRAPKDYFQGLLPLGDLMAQFGSREDLPKLQLPEKLQQENLEMVGSYDIYVERNDIQVNIKAGDILDNKPLKSARGLSLSEVSAALSDLPATARTLGAKYNLKIVCNRRFPGSNTIDSGIMELNYVVKQLPTEVLQGKGSGDSSRAQRAELQEDEGIWCISKMDRVTEREIVEMLVRMRQAGLIM